MKKLLVFITIISLFPFGMKAQRIAINPKFGAVSEEEVDMTSYPSDTSAAVVALYRSREIHVGINDVTGSLRKEIKVRDRWKILKEAGKDQVDYEIYRSTRNDFIEQVKSINVTTYNREGGKIVSQKMSKKYIFDNKYADGLNRVTFAPENVKVGSVVEVSYLFITPSLRIGRVDLQKDYPINISEVNVTYANFLKQNRFTLGRLPIDVDRSEEPRLFGDGDSYYDITDSYRMTDVPALKDVSYLYCPEFYRTGVSYDLRSIYLAGVIAEDYATTWENVDDRFIEAALLRHCKEDIKEVKDLDLSACKNETERIAAVRNFIMEKVAWDEKITRLPESARATLKKGKGDSADINALVASALNTLGYKAEPVLIKRRNSGPMVDFMISMDAFDAMVLRVICPNGEEHYLDAVRQDGYVDILVPNDLVEKARLIGFDKKGSWINLNRELAPNTVTENVVLKFDGDRLTGQSRGTATGLYSYNVRHKYHSYPDAEKWIENEAEEGSVEILEMSLNNPELYTGQSVVNQTFETDVTTGPDHLYIDVFLDKLHSENAFQKEDRGIPVEFPFPGTITYRWSLLVPDGYEVESLPENAAYVFDADSGTRVVFQCRRQDKMISAMYKMTLASAVVHEQDYKSLRVFWEQLCRIEQSVVTLKKL